MTHPIDDHTKMTPTEPHGPLGDDRAVERLLAGRDFATEPELAQVLTILRGLGAIPPPPPSAALAAVLADGLARPAPAHRRSGRLRQLALRTSIILATLTGGLVTAATANALPAPAQRVVARVVEAVTSITLPQPHAQPQNPSPMPASNTPRIDEPGPTQSPSGAAQPSTASDNSTGSGDHQRPDAFASQHGQNGDSQGPQGNAGPNGPDTPGDATPSPARAPAVDTPSTPSADSGGSGDNGGSQNNGSNNG